MKLKFIYPYILVAGFFLSCEEDKTLLDKGFVGFENQDTEADYVVPNLGETERVTITVQYGGPVSTSPINVQWEIDEENTTAEEGVHYDLITTGDLVIPAGEFTAEIEFDVILDGFATVALPDLIGGPETVALRIIGSDFGTEPNLSLTTHTINPLCTNCSIFWTGPKTTFNYDGGGDATSPDNQDRLTDNVWFARGENYPIFNAATESEFNFGDDGYASSVSPAGTEWALGSISDGVENLNFDTFAAVVVSGQIHLNNGNSPLVVHLIEDDIYLDLTWIDWHRGNGADGGLGGFSYERSTPE